MFKCRVLLAHRYGKYSSTTSVTVDPIDRVSCPRDGLGWEYDHTPICLFAGSGSGLPISTERVEHHIRRPPRRCRTAVVDAGTPVLGTGMAGPHFILVDKMHPGDTVAEVGPCQRCLGRQSEKDKGWPDIDMYAPELAVPKYALEGRP